MIRSNKVNCVRTYVGNRLCGMYIGNDIITYGSLLSYSTIKILIKNFPDKINKILDYVRNYPELVPFINEDPMLVCSLVERIGTRWLKGNRAAYIKTGFTPNQDTSVLIDFQGTNIQEDAMMYCSRRGYGDLAFNLTWASARSTWACGYYNNPGIFGIADYNRHIIELRKNKSYLDGVLQMTMTYAQFTTPAEAYLMAGNTNGRAGAAYSGKMFSCEVKNGETLIQHFVPFIHKDNGMEYYGMIDLLTGTFYGDATGNNGFTISEILSVP